MKCRNCPNLHLPCCAGERDQWMCLEDIKPKDFLPKSLNQSNMAGYPRNKPKVYPWMDNRQLVVSRYKEDLGWLANVRMAIVVYNKGDVINDRFRDHVEVYPLRNVGREAQTMTSHIVNNWGNLAEYTIFVQGKPFDHCPDFFDRIHTDWEDVTPISTQYLPHMPDQAIKDMDLTWMEKDFQCRLGWGDCLGQFDGGRGRTTEWCHRVWGELFDVPPPDKIWFCYGAFWSVPRLNIERRGFEFWRSLDLILQGPAGESQIDRNDDDPLTAWAMELLWKYVFDDPKKYPHKDLLRDQPQPSPELKAMAKRARARRKKGCKTCG